MGRSCGHAKERKYIHSHTQGNRKKIRKDKKGPSTCALIRRACDGGPISLLVVVVGNI